MFQYRQVLVRLRQGDSDRDIARSRLMGRPKVAAFRALAGTQGWLAADTPLPDDVGTASAAKSNYFGGRQPGIGASRVRGRHSPICWSLSSSTNLVTVRRGAT
jgi:hypothetical protein